MKTKDRLAKELTAAKAPNAMIQAALKGRYDDYESESPTPIGDLVRDCRNAGLHDISAKAMNGEFDGTKEESEAWFRREGAKLLRKDS